MLHADKGYDSRANRSCLRRRGIRPRIAPSGVLAKHYGFTDLDGSQPEASRFVADAYVGDDKDAKAEDYR